MNNKYTYIDLFSGAGGLSLGFERAGFENIFSVEIEKDYCETYKTNFPDHNLIEKDITKVSNKEILSLVRGIEVDVVVGGPPCQGFSIAGKLGRTFVDDPRNYLFKEFARVVSIVKPKFFVMENVARLYNHNKGKTRAEIIKAFEELGYDVDCKILCSADYGVAQIRNRIIFIGNRLNIKNIFPEKTVKKYRTIKEVIDDLPKLKAGEKSNIPNHEAMNHTKEMLNKMSYVGDGGNRVQIPLDLRPKSGDVRKYIRYDSSKPSICITGDMRKVFHYEQNRALTVRELARIQSFPDTFIFKGSKISQQQQVGNAVPPLMAEAIAKQVKKSLDLFMRKKLPKINFIGNKEKIVDWIFSHIPKDVTTIFDAFSGGVSVSYEAKKRGFRVLSNDILSINYLLAKALIENNKETLNEKDVNLIFDGKPKKGFMYEHYSEVLFFPEECMELDQYRENIEKLDSDYKKALAYILIRRAMIRKMPYSRFNLPWNKIKQLRDEEYSYKKYRRRRAYHNKSFKEHFLENLEEYNDAIFNNGMDNKAYNEDIFELIPKIEADLIYLDPPYTGTMNNYFGFYGVIDEYIKNKKIKPFKNNFVDKKTALILFDKLFSKLDKFKYWLLSYNNSSYPTKEQLLNLIKKYSNNIEVIERKHIYQVTGKERKTKNKEYLFIVKNG